MYVRSEKVCWKWLWINQMNCALRFDSDSWSTVLSYIYICKGYISSKQSICGGCKMSRADKTCTDRKTFSPFHLHIWIICDLMCPLSAHYIVMFEEAQHPQLSEDPLTGDQVLEDIGHLLQSHLATVTWIGDRPAGKKIENRRKFRLPRKSNFLWERQAWHYHVNMNIC